MNSKRWSRLLLRLLPVCAFVGSLCTVTSLDTGGSSGTEVSEVTGSVIDRAGNPVAEALVRLRPAGFLADSAADTLYRSTHSLFDTVTGVDGKFIFSGMEADSYVIEININDTLGSFAEFRIDNNNSGRSLRPCIVEPMAILSGSIQISYGFGALASVQIYGLDRSARIDSTGDFTLPVPGGKHQIHIGANLGDASCSGEFDGIDLSLEFFPGEQRDAGSFKLRPPPPHPCTDGSCDTAVVRLILEKTGKGSTPLESVITAENSRIVELDLRGVDLSKGIEFGVNRLAALRLLDLGETGLPSMFPDIGRMTHLETVRLDGNMLTDFASTVGNLKDLRELDLHGNRLIALHPSLLKCEQIEILDVSDNRLCTVDAVVAAWLDKADPGWKTLQQCD